MGTKVEVGDTVIRHIEGVGGVTVDIVYAHRRGEGHQPFASQDIEMVIVNGPETDAGPGYVGTVHGDDAKIFVRYWEGRYQ